MRAGKLIVNLDSSTSMEKALVSYLKGKPFKNLGGMPSPAAPMIGALSSKMNKLPLKLKENFYKYMGGSEALPASKTDKMDVEKISRWYVNQYPKRKYSAIMIGSSNGALIHLCAALGIPWLPQTTLLPIKRTEVDINHPAEELEWCRGPGRKFLEANPDVKLHVMLDPVQDYLMSMIFSYFRFKRTKLGPHYEKFIENNLEPGGTIITSECMMKWPSVKIDERHYFQFGAPGGASLNEYYEGSPRVEAYLARYDSGLRKWEPPKPDSEPPEAEWGFDDQLREDVLDLARKKDYKMKRIIYDLPQNPSPFVADLYRWWYEKRGIDTKRLTAETFVLIEPYMTFRTASIPYWLVFSTETYDKELEEYIQKNGPFEDIGINLYAHGVDSPGLVPIDRWRSIAGMATRKGSLIGVDEDAFPSDFTVFSKYHLDYGEAYSARFPLPGYLSTNELEKFIGEKKESWTLRWEDGLAS